MGMPEYVLKILHRMPMAKTSESRPRALGKVGTMATGAISAASLSEYVLSSSNSTQLQQALQALQNSLTAGNLDSAQAAFQTVQKLNQGLATASNGSSSSAVSTDLTALGSALSSGNLSSAQSAFATLQSDLKSSNSPSQAIETNVASESAQLVAELLSPLNVSNSSSSSFDNTTSVLEQVYGSKNGGSKNGLNVVA